MLGTILAVLRTGQAGKLIAGRWREIAIAGLLAIVLYQNVSDTRWILFADTIPYLKNTIATKDYELNIIEQANKTLTEAIEERNAEIQRWADVTKQLEQNTAVLQDEISNIAIKANSRVREVIRERVPQTCSAAIEYLSDAIPELTFDEIPTEDEETLP